MERPGDQWWAGILGAWPWCSPCWKPAAISASGDRDIYLNVAGGLRISEPAADLAAAAALASSAFDQALPQDCVVFGEISLSGEIRPVSRMDARLKEAAKLGFRRALGPADGEASSVMGLTGVNRLTEAVRRIGEGAWD